MLARKNRVLIADDEKHIRMLLKAVAASLNLEVVGEAANGQEAVEGFRREKPDLLLLDINMPLKTGEEVLREIAGQSSGAAVIMLTSVADGETIQRCIALGAANYIRKDTPLPEMKRVIQETLAAGLPREEDHAEI